MKKLIQKLKSIDKGTIFRTLFLILTYINQLVALIGKTSFADNVIYQWTSLIVTILISAINYWYNNDWSNAAIMARDVFDMAKDGKIDKEEISEFIESHKKTEENK